MKKKAVLLFSIALLVLSVNVYSPSTFSTEKQTQIITYSEANPGH
ncbi:hypothetical protein ACFCP7_25495 [Paenibacillus elgii]